MESIRRINRLLERAGKESPYTRFFHQQYHINKPVFTYRMVEKDDGGFVACISFHDVLDCPDVGKTDLVLNSIHDDVDLTSAIHHELVHINQMWNIRKNSVDARMKSNTPAAVLVRTILCEAQAYCLQYEGPVLGLVQAYGTIINRDQECDAARSKAFDCITQFAENAKDGFFLHNATMYASSLWKKPDSIRSMSKLACGGVDDVICAFTQLSPEQQHERINKSRKKVFQRFLAAEYDVNNVVLDRYIGISLDQYATFREDKPANTDRQNGNEAGLKTLDLDAVIDMMQINGQDFLNSRDDWHEILGATRLEDIAENLVAHSAHQREFHQLQQRYHPAAG